MPSNRLLVGLVATLCFGISTPSQAQSGDATSREVVQPLPSPEVQRLNRALKRLARAPRNLGALVEAGNAALQLGDLDAAMGFFGRAQNISPTDSRVKMGMAAVFLRSSQPIEALRLFNEAEASGASAREVLADRGLAFDLVGNNAQAQESYRAALALNDDDEAIRRLALSQAIAGDRSGFEETLRPLLEKRDFGAFRTQAFGLAILGEEDEATAIADAVMPRDLASRMTPYLQFMPRLTKSQQAAAANLGIFPAAADVGRDDPRIAQYAGAGSAISDEAESRLTPSGTPLGQAVETTADAVVQEIPSEASPPETVRVAQVEDATELVSVSRGSSASSASASSETPRPGFDLARVNASKPSTETEGRPSVADAFAGFATGSSDASSPTSDGSVDLTSIEIPREAVPEQEVEEQGPQHPSRRWVQIATGRDRSALRFDWRRFARSAPDLLGDFTPHVVSWGQSNRLLAGPIDNARDARALVNALSEKGIDTFTYTSPEGQEIQKLN